MCCQDVTLVIFGMPWKNKTYKRVFPWCYTWEWDKRSNLPHSDWKARSLLGAQYKSYHWMPLTGKPGHENGKYLWQPFWGFDRGRNQLGAGPGVPLPDAPLLAELRASLALLWVVPPLKITCPCVAFIITPSLNTVLLQWMHNYVQALVDSVLASRSVWLYLCTSWGRRRGSWDFYVYTHLSFYISHHQAHFLL